MSGRRRHLPTNRLTNADLAIQALAYLVEGYPDAVPDRYVIALFLIAGEEIERRELQPQLLGVRPPTGVG